MPALPSSSRRRAGRIGSFLAVLILAALAVALPSGSAAAPPFTIHALAVGRVEPGASGPERLSYAGVAATAPTDGPLLVLLGGTGSDPSGYRLFSEEALRLGFHVLVLAYPDATSVGSLCRDDLTCYGAVRREMILGVDASSRIDVAPPDAIAPRMLRDLQALAARYPGEGWGAYLAADGIAWPRVVMAGFSQGAGHALWIARHRPLRGLLLFSGPVDGRIHPPYRSATWIVEVGTWATPRSRIRAFVNTNDGYYPAIRQDLTALGLDPATGTPVGDVTPGAPGGPLYVTRALAANAHASVIEDAATPLAADGRPRYAAVWDAMLTGW